jgi:hypothetical protein
MNLNDENELEALIDRELKALPPLTAPDALAARIMSKATAPQSIAWYQAGWQNWPLALRATSFLILLAVFAGLCFGGWQISQIKSVSQAGEKVSTAFALMNLAGEILGVLRDAVVLVVGQVGIGYFLGALAVLAAAYAMCLALGSFYVRFAFSAKNKFL